MPLTSPKLIILESVDSTNNYAMAMVQKGVANSGDAVFAMEQSSGKGRRGKTWKSRKRGKYTSYNISTNAVAACTTSSFT